MNWTEETLRPIIAQILEEMGRGSGGCKETDPSGVLLVHTGQVACQNFEGRQDVRVRDVTTLQEAPRMAAGVMEVERTQFPWTLSYDEYDLVLSGTLEIRVGERTYTGRPGDLFYIPKGSSISFCSPDKARYVYVTYPADWQGQGKD